MSVSPYVTEKGLKVPRFEVKTIISSKEKLSYELKVRADTIEELIASEKELIKKLLNEVPKTLLEKDKIFIEQKQGGIK